MNPNEFDRSLMEGLSQLPPSPGEVQNYNPWRSAMTKILWGMGLIFFQFEFFYLQYLLPMLGAVLLYLGYRTLRRENRWFTLCWGLSGLYLLFCGVTYTLNATPLMAQIAAVPALNIGLGALSSLLHLALLAALRQGIRTSFTAAERRPKDWIGRAALAYLAALCVAVWTTLVPLTAQPEGPISFGPEITNEELYYARTIAMAVLFILVLVCIGKQRSALTGLGYAVRTAPARLPGPVFLGLVVLVLAGSVTTALWLSSRAPVLEGQPLSSLQSAPYVPVRERLVELGMDPELADALDEEELERCREAQAVYRLSLWHSYGQHTYSQEEEASTRADVEHIALQAWAVELPGDQARYYLTFRWLQNPERNIQDGLTGDPSSYNPSYDFSARILWTQGGQTWTAAPDVHLAGGETPEELPDWALDWYDYALEPLGHLPYIPWCSFTFPADSGDRWGWIAWSEDHTGWEEHFPNGVLNYQASFLYRHQISWLRYPYYSFPQLLASGSIPRDGAAQTIGGIYVLNP